MNIAFCDTRMNEEYRTILVKEKEVNYDGEIFNSPEIIIEMLRKLTDLHNMAEEYCYMLAMNTKSRLLGIFFISKGNVNSNIVGTREVFMRALLIGASQIVLCHNHPSKDCTPSGDDIRMTKKFVGAGRLLNVTLADHIIIGGDEYYSFHENEELYKW